VPFTPLVASSRLGSSSAGAWELVASVWKVGGKNWWFQRELFKKSSHGLWRWVYNK
jgi:hypothetical protein